MKTKNLLLLLFWTLFNVSFARRKRQFGYERSMQQQFGDMRQVSDMSGDRRQFQHFGDRGGMGQFGDGGGMGQFGDRRGMGQMAMEDVAGNVRHKVKMGEKHHECDDGESNLYVDWDGHPQNYTCYHPTRRLMPNHQLSSLLECESLPKSYLPQHFCMNQPIHYNESIPTHGDHRPIWPKFGEYRFTPPQRWLHNIEHGAVVMLYHPCVHHTQVEKLRSIVKGCLRKHIITPSTLLTEERPLALVAWGCRLLLSAVDEAEVVNFIRVKGLQGPEGFLPKEGQFTQELLSLASPPPGSDNKDSNLCPNFI